MPTHLAAQESDSAASTSGLPVGDPTATPGGDSTPPTTPAAESSGVADTETGSSAPEAAERISGLRERIDEIDSTLIALWQERAELSRQVGATRVASGGTRLVLARERQILDRFRDALGADGTQLGLLLLRAGRGPL